MRNSMRLLALAVLVMVVLDQALSVDAKSQTKDKLEKAKHKRPDTTEGRETKQHYKSTGQYHKSKKNKETPLMAQAAQELEEPTVNESDEQKLYRKVKKGKRSVSTDEMVQEPKMEIKIMNKNKKHKSRENIVEDVQVQEDTGRGQQGSKATRSRRSEPSSSIPVQGKRLRRESQVVEMEEQEEPNKKKRQQGSSGSLPVEGRRRRQSQVVEVEEEEEEPVVRKRVQVRWCEPMMEEEEEEEEAVEEQEPELSALQRYIVEEHIPEEDEEEEDLIERPLNGQPKLQRCYYK